VAGLHAVRAGQQQQQEEEKGNRHARRHYPGLALLCPPLRNPWRA
jgi:hypothetical protein